MSHVTSRRVVVWCALILLVATAFNGALARPAAASATSAPVDGRLGGTKASVEKRFGKNTGQDERVHGLGYNVKGYGDFVVAYANDQAVSITLIANRTSHSPLNEADPADWPTSQVEHFASKFLPSDVKLDNAPQDTGDGRLEGACHSAALKAVFSMSAWKKLHAGGNPGECHYLMSPDTNGAIYRIDFAIGRSGALDRPTEAPTDTPAAQSGKATTEEVAYIAAVTPILESNTSALYAFSSEMSAPDIFSDAWTLRVAADIVTIQLNYKTLQTITPPDAFAGSYGLMLQAMSLMNDSTNDFSAGVDQQDASLISKATDEMSQAGELIQQATDQFNAEVAAIKAR